MIFALLAYLGLPFSSWDVPRWISPRFVMIAGKSEWPELSDDELVFTIKPLAREVYELLVSDKASDA